MRLSGFVTINGTREYLDWTITGSEIVEGPGVSASEIALDVPLPQVQAAEIYEDEYENQTVTELKVLLQQRGEPIYGNKEQLIARLRGWDANNPAGYQEVVEVVSEETSANDFVDLSDDAYDEAGPEDESEEGDDDTDGVEGE